MEEAGWIEPKPPVRLTGTERFNGMDATVRDFWIWSRQDTRRYFLAGGGREGEFEALWSAATREGDAFDRAVAARTYAGAGAAIGYLVAGRKP